MTRPSIALVGGTGGLGLVVLREFLATGFKVRLLRRKGASSTLKDLGLDHGQTPEIVEVDYAHVDGLTKALHCIDVVICTVATAGIDTQIPLIEASIAAGVKRFIPSEFGADPEHPRNKDLPMYTSKNHIGEYLAQKVAENDDGQFSYTRVITNAWLDWGIREGFLCDAKTHTIRIFDGGNTLFSFTTLPTVARALIAIVGDLDGTENRQVFVHDAAITQNQMIRWAQDADGIDWTIKEETTRKLLEVSLEELRKRGGDVGRALMEITHVAVFDRDRGPDLTDRLDNEMLGIPVMTEAEVAEVIKRVMISVGK